MLTEKRLKEMPKNYIFASGEFKLGGIGSRKYRWVAVTGNNDDWCIYYGDLKMSDIEVSDMGIKLYDERKIRDLVPHEYLAFKRYRY